MKSNSPSIPMEWLLETLNKRIAQGIKLSDLFLCIPYPEEAEFEFELTNAFKTTGVSQGNDLNRDYPHLAKLITSSRKASLLRVFFIHPSRLDKNVLLHKRKYKYPKVSQVAPARILANKAFENVLRMKDLIN